MNLVTGATGLIGGWLLLELSKRGKPIRAIKRKTSSIQAVRKLFHEFLSYEHFEKIEWIEADLLDLPSLSQSLSGVETVYHAAASVNFNHKHKKEIYKTNVSGTENLVNLAMDAGVRNMVCISSISTLDKDENKNLINEQSKWNPELLHSWYAISKKKTEMEFYRIGEEGRINILIANPGVVIGGLDGHRPSESIFYNAFKKWSFSTTGQTAFVDVRDVAYCIAQLVEKACWQEKFIISAGNKKFSEVFDFLRNERNLSHTILINNSTLKVLRILSQFGSIFGTRLIDKAAYSALTNQISYDNQKIKKTLDFEFIPIEDSLRFHGHRYLENRIKA